MFDDNEYCRHDHFWDKVTRTTRYQSLRLIRIIFFVEVLRWLSEKLHSFRLTCFFIKDIQFSVLDIALDMQRTLNQSERVHLYNHLSKWVSYREFSLASRVFFAWPSWASLVTNESNIQPENNVDQIISTHCECSFSFILKENENVIT